MRNAYSIDVERMIADCSEIVVRGLTLGTISDNEATKVLRAVRRCAMLENSSSSTTPASTVRREVALASLDPNRDLEDPWPARSENWTCRECP